MLEVGSSFGSSAVLALETGERPDAPVRLEGTSGLQGVAQGGSGGASDARTTAAAGDASTADSTAVAAAAPEESGGGGARALWLLILALSLLALAATVLRPEKTVTFVLRWACPCVDLAARPTTDEEKSESVPITAEGRQAADGSSNGFFDVLVDDETDETDGSGGGALRLMHRGSVAPAPGGPGNSAARPMGRLEAAKAAANRLRGAMGGSTSYRSLPTEEADPDKMSSGGGAGERSSAAPQEPPFQSGLD